MTNSKTNKAGGTRKDALDRKTDLNIGETCSSAHEADDNYRVKRDNVECFGRNQNIKYSDIDESEDVDGDEVDNDGDTSTSFSLQECMNEFRARRFRRSSLTQYLQDSDKRTFGGGGKDFQESTEMDLINQNLCNKEQERKCKPCQNGFCYCFTSDSGDGGINLSGCNKSRNKPARNSRRNRKPDFSEFAKEASFKLKPNVEKSKEKDNFTQAKKTPEKKITGSCVKGTTIAGNQLNAISILETSKREAPLIHIIQELRDNCVISKVKVNKHKMQLHKGEKEKKVQISQKKTHLFDHTAPDKVNLNKNSFIRCRPEHHSPTAPTLENISEFDIKDNNKSSRFKENAKSNNCEHHRSAGGQLLHKRLSNSTFNYKPRNIKQAPPKPPRISIHCDDKYSGSLSSTSPSVREAERVLDDFLNKRGFNVLSNSSTTKNVKSTKNHETVKNAGKTESTKRRSYPMTPKDIRNQTKNLFSTYPSLSNVEESIELKTPAQYGINIKPGANCTTKVIGWNEDKINDMLNYDSNTKRKEFNFTDMQAEPQQRASCDVVGNENPIGWKMPQKINLDTVDGIVCHNFISNLEDKNTPVKAKLMESSTKAKDNSRTERFIWSEQLRQLSPWSNKNNNDIVANNKSNLRSTSKAFLKSSKKKILKLVSPKKENKDRRNIKIRKTPHRNVAVQTSCDELFHLNIRNPYEKSSSPQSPPGSYHSPIQSSHIQPSTSTQSQNNTPIGVESIKHFDFSRTVHSPPKKAPRSSQRKLNFPLNCTLTSKEDNVQIKQRKDTENNKETYRSFNSELEQDVSISKISYILSNIRAKLEATDERAVRTFLETEFTSDNRTTGFDCPDAHNRKRIEELPKIHEIIHPSHYEKNFVNDPIYSEIEDDSVHIAESANIDNHTGLHHISTAENPEILYAKVNKCNKKVFNAHNSPLKEPKSQIPLAKIMLDSLKSKKIITNITPLPPLPEPLESESVSYSSPMSVPVSLTHCQSLNNIRVKEHNSTPKRQRNLSKSNLSLNRSEIFLENLCRSELILDVNNIEPEKLGKIENDKKNATNTSYIAMFHPSPDDVSNLSFGSEEAQPHNDPDTVSYEIPNDEDNNDFAESIDIDNSTTAGSNLGLSTIVPPSSHNQSTPKKKSFTTKDKSKPDELIVNVGSMEISDHLSSSCPNTPYKQDDIPHVDQRHSTFGFPNTNLVSEYEAVKNSSLKSMNAFGKYKSFKNVLQKSFRKSKTFIRTEGKRLSTSLNFSINNATPSPTLARGKQSIMDSTPNMETLFSLTETASISEQIAEAVTICRKLPDVEISTEMVEAERLLLFSALRRKNQWTSSLVATRSQTMNQMPKMCFFIDDMFLPVIPDVNKDIFFNYFYIVTFECGGVIKSTQSAECVNGIAVFQDCGIEFISNAPGKCLNKQSAVKCNIFMLRLRKISTISVEPNKIKTIGALYQNRSSTTISTKSSSSSSSTEIVSRFRLHASFTLDACDFVPYEYVPQETNNSDRICIRSSCLCTIPIKPKTKSTNLSGKINLKGRAEVRFPKLSHGGFLNVEDPYAQHNWNRRWCTIDGIFLFVWQDENILNKSPLLKLDLRDTKCNSNSPLKCSPRELCARPRSFCLQCKVRKSDEDVSTATVFFAAETQDDLENWLKELNTVLDFILTWL